MQTRPGPAAELKKEMWLGLLAKLRDAKIRNFMVPTWLLLRDMAERRADNIVVRMR